MHDNRANNDQAVKEFTDVLRDRLKIAVMAAGSLNDWALANGFQASDLSRFLNGQKDWTLSKVVLLISQLGGEISVYPGSGTIFVHDFKAAEHDRVYRQIMGLG